MKKWEAYLSEFDGWLVRRSDQGMSLEAASALAKALNAAAGRLQDEARVLARAWRVA